MSRLLCILFLVTLLGGCPKKDVAPECPAGLSFNKHLDRCECPGGVTYNEARQSCTWHGSELP